MLPILLLIVLDGISQTSKDTVCLPIEQVKKAISIIEVGKVHEEELILTKKALQIADSRILLKDSIINLYAQNDKFYKEIIEGYKKNITNSDQIIDSLEKSLTLERRRIRWQKLTKWLTAVGGITFGILISK